MGGGDTEREETEIETKRNFTASLRESLGGERQTDRQTDPRYHQGSPWIQEAVLNLYSILSMPHENWPLGAETELIPPKRERERDRDRERETGREKSGITMGYYGSNVQSYQS